MAHQAPANRSRYGAVAGATGETFEPDRSDVRWLTSTTGVAAVAGCWYRKHSLAGSGVPIRCRSARLLSGHKGAPSRIPEHDGPTAVVPVHMGNAGLEERDGIEAKTVVLEQLRAALAIIQEHDPARITTVGGECSVSMAPFSHVINKHGDDLAILWIDSHPDMGTGETAYPGFHAMVVSALTGHGDQELLEILPATTTADRVALVGMHDWTDPTLPAIADEWGLSVFSPDALRSSSAPLLDWLDTGGATKVAIHFDVDTVDADEIQLGLGADRGGLTSTQVRRVVADIDGMAEVIALTIAEFIPRQVMHLQQILAGFPLLGRRTRADAPHLPTP
jgi:arginase